VNGSLKSAALGLLALALLPSTAACGAAAAPRDPRQTLDAYARALEAGKVEEAYALLSDEAKKSIPFEAFSRIVRENPEEVKEIAQALSRPAGPPLVTATVSAPNGEALLLVYEDGHWKVDGSAIDLYSQATPKATVASFLRAYENRRYDVLLRFVPDRERTPEAGPALDSTKLKRAFEGEQREELEQITQGLRAALPTAKIEMLGDRATMAYGTGSTVELVREHGAWKIEEFK
jgi:hypothetical protein